MVSGAGRMLRRQKFGSCIYTRWPSRLEAFGRLCQDARLLAQILQKIRLEVASALQGNIMHPLFERLVLTEMQPVKAKNDNFIFLGLLNLNILL